MNAIRSMFVVGALASGTILMGTDAKADGMARGPYAPSWTGLYLGAGAGYGTFVNSFTSVDTATGIPDRPFVGFGGDGWLGTVVVGYDQQIGNMVVGVFVDFDWSGAKGNIGDVADGPILLVGPLEQEHAWSLGARVGMLASPKTLLYLSGGYTQATFDDLRNSSASGLTVRSSKAQTYDGWFVGAGMETLLGSNLSLRLEYRYSDYEEKSFDRFLTNGVTLSTSHNVMDPTTQTGRVVLTYKFGREREVGPLK